MVYSFRVLAVALAWSIALFGCGGKSEDTARPNPPGPPDTTDTTDTHTGPVHTGDTAGLPSKGFVRVQRDAERLEALDLSVWSYEVRDQGYLTNDGTAPRFHMVLDPEWAEDEEERPVIFWLHGGVLGIPGDETYGRFCSFETKWKKGEENSLVQLVRGAIEEHDLILSMARDRGWIFVVPESDWCDFWAGRGPEDPVHTSNYSLWHIESILDRLEWPEGLDGVHVNPSQVYAWGTSIGGAGVLPVAHGLNGDDPRFAAVVSDSGPAALSKWEVNEWYSPILAHLFGGLPSDEEGKPTEYAENYNWVDGTLLLSERGFRTPVFHAYNRYDTLTPFSQSQAFDAGLEAAYLPEGVRYLSHDFEHRAPGERFHTQTQGRMMPWGYTAYAAMEFLSGKAVRFIEAESFCDTGCNLEEEEGTEGNQDPSPYSRGTVITRSPEDGEGILHEGVLSSTLARTEPLMLSLVLIATDLGALDNSVIAATITIETEKETIAQTRVQSGIWQATSTDGEQAQLAATTLGVTLPLGEEVTFRIDYHGVGKLWFDGLWVFQE